MSGAAMHPSEERVQRAVKIFITGAAAKTAKLAELRVGHTAILALQSLYSLGGCVLFLAGSLKI
ncbi:hypothetical protein D3C81_2270100 [compost metagenome]